MAESVINEHARDRLDPIEVRTHSFRRTALTQMSSAGVPLRVIQEISEPHSLQAPQRYLEISGLRLEGAVAVLSF
ncbi:MULTISPECIES: tyrosine-type recombinase/integrase [Trichocoleus]|uniref:Tyrosine-type recombinase/integrase n=1 Tax=Trichocoleus desertorum GB2-A4 TaxID=2933944 RepID=A0ABV0JGF3_9CYAN|nr:tyrosine-type recombinase/integrase [Trichocoleus sp. FACHB-46]MBD1865295.1 tyrosine-type recombinase/integrase [Trichocoleus sp. FACHB-46]